jgi:hypothetical protein
MKTLPKAIKQRRHPYYVWLFDIQYTRQHRLASHTQTYGFELRGFMDGYGTWTFELIFEPESRDEEYRWSSENYDLYTALGHAADVAHLKYKVHHEYGGFEIDERRFSRAISGRAYALACACLNEQFAKKEAA